jgi:hypothetical protein
MSAAPVQFDIIAEDEASDVFSTVSENFTEMSDTVSSASEEMSSTVTESMQGASSSSDEATSEIQTDTSEWEDAWNAAAASAQTNMGQIATSNQEAADATNTSSASFGQQALQMNSAAMSGAMLYMAINNIENAQVTLNRANLMEEKAANAVTLAQQAYNQAVAQYGPMSMQAEDAQNKLALAQQTQAVDQERVAEAQRNYNSTLLMSALTVIPAFVNIIGLAANAENIMTGAQYALDAAMDANPIGIIVLALAALAVGLYEAYEHIAPFRDAINDIGNFLKDVFIVAINDVVGALKWLWNALDSPVLLVILGPIGGLIYVFTHLHEVINDVGIVFTWLWNNCFAPVASMLMTMYNEVLMPIANFFETIFVKALNAALAPIKDFETGMKDVEKVLSPITNAISDLGGALGKLCFAHAAPAAEEFNKQLTQSLTLSDELAHKTSTLGSSLQALSSNVKIGSGTGTSTVNIASPAITINGSITGSASLKNVRDAVSKGICDAMFKKGIMNKVA